MDSKHITKEQWYAPNRMPPLDFTHPLQAFAFKHYRRWLWLVCKLWPQLGAQLVIKHLYEARRFPRPNRERELLKQAESFSLGFEEGELACWRFAPLRSEKTLKTAVLIHGWEGRAAQMGSLVEPLQRQGYQVYLMDLPAHGDSDGVRNNPTKAAAALARLGQKLDQIDLLLAHSFGCFASLLAMLNGLRVKRFIALAGVTDYRNTLRDIRLIFNVPASAKTVFDEALLKEFGLNDWATMNIKAQADKLTMPCTFMHDPADEDTPYFAAEELAGLLPAAEAIPVPDVGHRTIMWSPQVIEYLNTQLDH